MTTSKNSSTGKRIFTAILCVAIGGLALLLWARLKLVTGVPRTAIAVPEQNAPAQSAAPAPAHR